MKFLRLECDLLHVRAKLPKFSISKFIVVKKSSNALAAKYGSDQRRGKDPKSISLYLPEYAVLQ